MLFLIKLATAYLLVAFGYSLADNAYWRDGLRKGFIEGLYWPIESKNALIDIAKKIISFIKSKFNK